MSMSLLRDFNNLASNSSSLTFGTYWIKSSSLLPDNLLCMSNIIVFNWSIKCLRLSTIIFPYSTNCISHIQSVSNKFWFKPTCFSKWFLWFSILLYFVKLCKYNLSNWHSSISIKRLLSPGPFFIMDKSSGEKKTIWASPISSEDFLIGIPSMAIPLDLLRFKCISILWVKPSLSIKSLTWASDLSIIINSLSLLPLWDFVVPPKYIASSILVFPWALSP